MRLVRQVAYILEKTHVVDRGESAGGPAKATNFTRPRFVCVGAGKVEAEVSPARTDHVLR